MHHRLGSRCKEIRKGSTEDSQQVQDKPEVVKGRPRAWKGEISDIWQPHTLLYRGPTSLNKGKGTVRGKETLVAAKGRGEGKSNARMTESGENSVKDRAIVQY